MTNLVVFVKLYTGKSVTLQVELSSCTSELWNLVYNKLESPQFNLEEMRKATKFIRSGMQLNMDSSFAHNRIVEHSSIQQTMQSWTMDKDFNFETLLIEADGPVTLEPMQYPYMLNPGCAHSFEKETIVTLITQSLEKGNSSFSCPLCRMEIQTQGHRSLLSPEHQKKLLMILMGFNK